MPTAYLRLGNCSTLHVSGENQVSLGSFVDGVRPLSDDQLEHFQRNFGLLLGNLEVAIQGKRDVLADVLTCFLSEGHLLLEDVPGVGKTTIARALAASIEGSWARVQFTPDLLPSDVVGTTVYRQHTEDFEFHPGPVFNNVVIADEINRSSPKTQSALLEVMGERQVSVDGTTRPVPRPFMVVATMNPIDLAGTYRLPEAQTDRFLMRVRIGYPDQNDEVQILSDHGRESPVNSLTAVLRLGEVQSMIDLAATVTVDKTLQHYIVALANSSRTDPRLRLGISPRGTLAMQRAARTRAAAWGRTYVSPDDVKSLAASVWAHRLVITTDAELDGLATSDVIHDLLERTPVATGQGGL
jgi:MoxR-like ATPase